MFAKCNSIKLKRDYILDIKLLAFYLWKLTVW